MISRFRIPAVIAAFAFLAAAESFAFTPSWSYENSKVTSGEFPIHVACVMPSEGKLSRASMKGGEGMSKESDEWTSKLDEMVQTHLRSAGVQLLQASDPLASGASDDEIKQVILQVHQKYQEVSTQLNKKPKDIGKARFSLGDETALLPCSAKADVLVFVVGDGQVTSGGRKAMGMLVGGPGNTSYATLVLTMVDAKTGEVLAFARLSNAESFGEKFVDQTEDVYGKALDKQLAKLRIGQYLDKKP
jgi:curli biogenesis system outer membrane secretion channel CsgG